MSAICSKCQKVVDRVQIQKRQDGILFTVFCHGETEEVLVPRDFFVQTTGRADLEFGEAFKDIQEARTTEPSV